MFFEAGNDNERIGDDDDDDDGDNDHEDQGNLSFRHKFRLQSNCHKELFNLTARNLKEFEKTVVAYWLVASLHGDQLTIYPNDDDNGGACYGDEGVANYE